MVHQFLVPGLLMLVGHEPHVLAKLVRSRLSGRWRQPFAASTFHFLCLPFCGSPEGMCFRTYSSMNASNKSVMRFPSKAAIALKELCSFSSTLMFKRTVPWGGTVMAHLLVRKVSIYSYK